MEPNPSSSTSDSSEPSVAPDADQLTDAESDADRPPVVDRVQSTDTLLEHAYGEGLHALLQTRSPDAIYNVMGPKAANTPTVLTIHRPADNEHAFMAIETETRGQFAFSGAFGEIITALLRIYQDEFELEPVTVPPELPDFEG